MFEQMTYEYILNRMLDRIPNTVDKGEGSIIFDAIAPAAAEFAQKYIEMDGILLETYILTASGEHLEKRAAEQGLTREAATHAVKRGVFLDGDGLPVDVPINSRFTAGLDLVYVATEQMTDNETGTVIPGTYRMTCETAGRVGNSYTGEIEPVLPITDLATAYLDELLISAREEETDEELRARYLSRVNQQAFGGNFAQYEEQILALDGVGAVQIYPVWNGGGTVKCSIVDNEYNVATSTLIDMVQETIDPTKIEGHEQGEGLGLAPIGHTVDIVTADPVSIDVEATISIMTGMPEEAVISQVKEAIAQYIAEVRSTWGSRDEQYHYHQSVYLSRINYAILSVPGVENVTDITLNDTAEDLILEESAQKQELPVIGEVEIHHV